MKALLQHLLSHWPAHLAWFWPLVSFAEPSIRNYDSSHPGSEYAQIGAIVLSLIARYHAPNVGKAAVIFFVLLVWGASASAQTPAPSPSPAPATVSTTVNFSIGAQAFGLDPTNTGTPAVDAIVSFNPNFSKAPNFSLMTDALEAPGSNFQYYGGGASYEFTTLFPKSSALSPLRLYVRGTLGVAKFAPATGPSVSHAGFLVGGGPAWDPAPNVHLQLFEIDWGHFPGAPWGTNKPVVAGGLSMFFGKH